MLQWSTLRKRKLIYIETFSRHSNKRWVSLKNKWKFIAETCFLYEIWNIHAITVNVRRRRSVKLDWLVCNDLNNEICGLGFSAGNVHIKADRWHTDRHTEVRIRKSWNCVWFLFWNDIFGDGCTFCFT